MSRASLRRFADHIASRIDPFEFFIFERAFLVDFRGIWGRFEIFSDVLSQQLPLHTETHETA
jgi:hypothetical protein